MKSSLLPLEFHSIFSIWKDDIPSQSHFITPIGVSFNILERKIQTIVTVNFITPIGVSFNIRKITKLKERMIFFITPIGVSFNILNTTFRFFYLSLHYSHWSFIQYSESLAMLNTTIADFITPIGVSFNIR